MLLTNCLIPIITFVVGFALKMWPPEDINSAYGYRTPFSKKNKDTWNEGNHFCGNILVYIGVISLIISILCSIIYKNNIDVSSRMSSIISVVLLMVSIPCTEIHLRKLFDKNGNRKL